MWIRSQSYSVVPVWTGPLTSVILQRCFCFYSKDFGNYLEISYLWSLKSTSLQSPTFIFNLKIIQAPNLSLKLTTSKEKNGASEHILLQIYNTVYSVFSKCIFFFFCISETCLTFFCPEYIPECNKIGIKQRHLYMC